MVTSLLPVEAIALYEWKGLQQQQAQEKFQQVREALQEELQRKQRLITVAGMIGVGKTTFVYEVVGALGIMPIYELDGKNDEVKDDLLRQFLLDPKTHCLPLQQHLLPKRRDRRLQVYRQGESCIEDRSPEEDLEIFHRRFEQQGYLTSEQRGQLRQEAIQTYQGTPSPDLIIVLKAPAWFSRQRVESRGRPEEQDIWTLDELTQHANLYGEFPGRLPDHGYEEGQVILLDVQEFDSRNPTHQGYLFQEMLVRLQQANGYSSE